MDKAAGRLTVFFEEPFWVGVFERISEGKLSVCKVTFGAEPKDERESRRKPWRFSGAWAVTSARSAGGFRERGLTLFQTAKPAIDAVSGKTGVFPRRCGIWNRGELPPAPAKAPVSPLPPSTASTPPSTKPLKRRQTRG